MDARKKIKIRILDAEGNERETEETPEGLIDIFNESEIGLLHKDNIVIVPTALLVNVTAATVFDAAVRQAEKEDVASMPHFKMNLH